MYLNQYNGFSAPWSNLGRVLQPNQVEFVDPNTITDSAGNVGTERQAYWGVFYATAGGLSKEVFNCPSDTYLGRNNGGDGMWSQYGFERLWPGPRKRADA